MAPVTSLDLVRRVFRRDGPNQLWMTDITERPTREGKIYCCVVLDAFSRLVVGWSVESTQTTVLVTNALGMATNRRDGADGLVIHANGSVKHYVDGVRHRVGGRPASTPTGPRSGTAKASATATTVRRRSTRAGNVSGSSRGKRCAKRGAPASPRWSKRGRPGRLVRGARAEAATRPNGAS